MKQPGLLPVDEAGASCATIGFSDLFKIGLGPSSSHTTGPIRAAAAFAAEAVNAFPNLGRVTATVFGSLAWTGHGHATDRALLLGLSGLNPEELTPQSAAACAERIETSGMLRFAGRLDIPFDTRRDIIFDYDTVQTRHPNAMAFEVFDGDGASVQRELWFSVGGGFVEREGKQGDVDLNRVDFPYNYTTGAELVALCEAFKLTMDEIVEANEMARMPPQDLKHRILAVWSTMDDCVRRGLASEGVLPGSLQVRRRAHAIHQRLEQGRGNGARGSTLAMAYASAFAMAVNEENAAGGRVVTAPTNGAAGVIPAVLSFARMFGVTFNDDQVYRFFLTATAIGGIIKRNASISGAEVGCQGEVGSAAAMAAAGLTAIWGGTPRQIENAAEIALEHHLGMTCDPVAGLVQIPCIERNAFGAIKAINAANLALFGDGQQKVSFDQVVETMRQTGADMSEKYRETSRGGLAVNVPEC